MHTAGVARSIELSRHPEQAIPASKAELVSKAIMNACDPQKEGFVNNPRACTFDVSKLACSTASGANTDSCLTPAQMKTVETFYNGVKNSKGELIFSGQQITNPLPALAPPTGVPGGGYDTVRIWGFQNADYDWKTFDLDRDMPIINAKTGFVDAVDPDLSKFKARGGKLLLYAGWADTGITPENTVLYYESVLQKMGKNQGDFTRLFMVPGMAHCGGGAGPNTFDSIGALEVVAREGHRARRDHRVQPADGPVASSLSVSAVCEIQGHGQHEGRGELVLRRAVGRDLTDDDGGRSERTRPYSNLLSLTQPSEIELHAQLREPRRDERARLQPRRAGADVGRGVLIDRVGVEEVEDINPDVCPPPAEPQDLRHSHVHLRDAVAVERARFDHVHECGWALPASGRPSAGMTCALKTSQFAARLCEAMPGKFAPENGRLWTVADTSTSAFGTT